MLTSIHGAMLQVLSPVLPDSGAGHSGRRILLHAASPTVLSAPAQISESRTGLAGNATCLGDARSLRCTQAALELNHAYLEPRMSGVPGSRPQFLPGEQHLSQST